MKNRVKNLPWLGITVHDNGYGTHKKRRWMENSGRALGANGATTTATKASSSGVPQSSRSRSRRDERNFLCSADWMSVERLERLGHLQQLIGTSTFYGMDQGWRLPRVLGMWPSRLRRSGGHGLVMALDGRSDNQGTPGWGKKPVPIRRTGQKEEQREVCSLRPQVFLSASWSTVLIETISSYLSRPSRAFPFVDRSLRKRNRRECALIKGTTTPKFGTSPASSDSLLIFVRAVRKPRQSRTKLGFARDGGWLSGRMVG